ncbi:hypothetical protein [Flavipsychrobacter stenotrophus]|nr:hypothetical protein [Flavipsychrobacter stenotrophus]
MGQKMPDDYYEEGKAAVLTGDYAKVQADYKYLSAHYPQYDKYKGVYYAAATGYLLNKQYNEALSILKVQFADTLSAVRHMRYGAVMDVYECYKGLKQYDSALYYITLADTGCRYNTDCGNDAEDEAARRLVKIKNLYLLMNDTLNAEKVLLRISLLEIGPKRVEELLQYLSKDNSASDLKKQFTAAMKVNYHDPHPVSTLFRNNYIVFLGNRMYWGDFGGGTEYAKSVKNTLFYNMLMKLPDDNPAKKR